MNSIWIEASAGCGKTTLILNDFKNSLQRSLFISFSNATLDEFKKRLSNLDNIKCSTIHSLAFDFLKSRNQNLIIKDKSLDDEILAQLLQDENFKTLYFWLLKNDNLKLDIDLNKLDDFILDEEIPIINDNTYSVLFQNKVIFKEILDTYKKQFFNKNMSNKKNIIIKINQNIEAEIKKKYIDQIKNRIILHEKFYQKYILNMKKHIKTALINKEKEYKLDRNIIYYDDLLILCSNLIKKEPGIVFEILGNIKKIYIDETQDLSESQFNLIFLILQEWSAIGEKLLIVGDPKQLIYEFQGANIEQYNKFKKQIKNISNEFIEKFLNKTYRLPIKICEKLNNIGENLDINYQKHESISSVSGEVKIIKVQTLNEILPFLNNDTMILFKQKNEEMKNLAIFLMKNGYFINSPYVVEHPIIKDFQYLLKWLIYKDPFALGVVMHVFNKYEFTFEDLLKETKIMNYLNNLTFCNLNNLFKEWIFNIDVQNFLYKNLGNSVNAYIELLRKYCNFYKYNPYDAIYNKNEFYKNSKNLFEGIFFNTIHSSKGREADTVILLNCDFNAKFKHDTNRLLYVGLTRSKNKLIIPIKNYNCGNWIKMLID